MLKRSEIHLGRKGFLMKVFEHVFKKRPIGLSRADMVHALLNWMDDSANHAFIASSGDWVDLLDEPDSSEEKHSTIAEYNRLAFSKLKRSKYEMPPLL